MSIDLLLLFIVGVFTGAVNVIAGGGSLLSLPLLIFIGIPPIIANATNRVGIVMQNIFGIYGFHQKGVNLMRFSLPLGIAGILGSYVGASFALSLTDEQFKTVLAIVMLMVVAITVWNPSRKRDGKDARLTGLHQILATIAFFFIGIYGGFIQAGVGLLSISATTIINRLDLLRANCVKITVALFYATTSVIVFALHDKIWWTYGIALGIGTATGAWLMSRYSVQKGNKWLQRMFITVVIAMAIRLLIF